MLSVHAAVVIAVRRSSCTFPQCKPRLAVRRYENCIRGDRLTSHDCFVGDCCSGAVGRRLANWSFAALAEEHDEPAV